MHCHGHIAQHGFHAGGSHNHVWLIIVEGTVAYRNELALIIRVHNLDIGDRSLQGWRPVHQAVRAIDQPLIEQRFEDGLHRPGQSLIQGETLARPIHGITDGSHLILDDAAVAFLPLPHALNELLAGVIKAALAFSLFQAGFHLGLGGDTRVISTGQPQHLEALHALTARHVVHQGVVQGVAHVQLTGDVRRRQHDTERWLRAGSIRREVSLVYPALVEVLFYLCRVPCSRQLGGTVGADGTSSCAGGLGVQARCAHESPV